MSAPSPRQIICAPLCTTSVLGPPSEAQPPPGRPRRFVKFDLPGKLFAQAQHPREGAGAHLDELWPSSRLKRLVSQCRIGCSDSSRVDPPVASGCSRVTRSSETYGSEG